jgi:hypothetical protein
MFDDRGFVQGGTRHAEGARAAQRTEVGGMDERFGAEQGLVIT